MINITILMMLLGFMFCTITSTQTEQAVRNVAVGRYISDTTAGAFNITCGFKPRYVCVENVTAREKIEWFEGMTDAYAIKTIAAGTRTLATSLGITPLAGGFTVGLDTLVNVTSEQISWIAIG